MSSGSDRLSHFIFLARHSNDIDHITPVIWGMLRVGVSADRIRYINILPDESVEPARDARLQFLANQRVPLETPHIRGTGRQLLYKLSVAPMGNMVRRKARKYLYRKMVKGENNVATVLQAITEAPPNSVLITDHGVSPEVETCLNKARERGFQTVALPHGFQLHFGFSAPETDRLLNPDKPSRLKKEFDHVLTCSPHQAEVMTLHPGMAKVVSAGLPRFTPEWLDKLTAFGPPRPDVEKPVVLMILEKGGVTIRGNHLEFINIEEQFRIVEHLANRTDIILHLKGNARGLSSRQGKMLKRFARFTVEDAIPTHDLITHADLVVGCCSSVLMDAYVRNKPVLLLEYAAHLKMAFERFGFFENPRSFVDFTNRLDKFVEGSGEKLYDENRLQKLIEYYVYGGKPRHNVVDAYAEYIRRLTK